ncbi:hypothetical protein HYFRA_00009273 [Hymenoscyphus fraxineus]|uniref:CSI2 protein n=1 Tax=Hymenoscyphus fraxineus TaxID=746836 RepID=A0A9N9L4W9_9HELO|nr:hypothetical protein HYFRA_00009273 [Hymenoscyphus fraxineus]
MRLLRGISLAPLALFAINAAAQGNADLPNLATAAPAGPTSAESNTAAPPPPAAATTDAAPASTSIPMQSTGVITGSGTTGASVAASSITGAATATDGGELPTGLPTLRGQYSVVPASVPPTQNAPYMQSSHLPEGTVFIVVGAILGFMAMSVLLWRAMVAWSLHRSVKRAAMQQNMSDSKALFRTPAAPFYKDHPDRDSTISLSGLGAKGGKKGARPTTGSGAAANASSLFFSPTAGAAGGGLNTVGNRGSSYLPAGYYAAGNSSPGNSQSHISIGQHGSNISMSNLGPTSGNYGRPSPPESPSLIGSRGNMASSSTLNLTQGYSGEQRAPSAFLEDLFDGETGPPLPGHHSNGSGAGHRF